MAPRRRRKQLHHPRVFRPRFGEPPRHRKDEGQPRSGSRIDGVQRDRLAIELDGPRRVPPGQGKSPRGDDDCRICRGQGQSAPHCLGRPVPIKIEIELNRRAGKQRFRQIGLDRQGPRRCLARASQMVVEARPSYCAGGNAAVPHMRLSQTRPSQRERRVQLHRPLILGQRLAGAFFRAAIAIKTALQIMLVGLHIFRPAFFRRLYLRLNRRLGRRIHGAIRQAVRSTVPRWSGRVRFARRTRPLNHA